MFSSLEPLTGVYRYLADSAFILPPLAEQKRIVAKVDELMAVCDQLEAQQQQRDTQHTALTRASLARFADAPTPANLNSLAEQRRIVAKVEQLMALVDALETQLATSRATAANLLCALVAELTLKGPESHE